MIPAIVVAGVLWWLRTGYVVVLVRGPSMRPTYRQGERVLLRRTTAGKLRRGQVVVVTGVSEDGAWLLKRAVAIPVGVVVRRLSPR